MKYQGKCKNNFWWKWKMFWGYQYRIYDKNNNLVNRVLVYRKRIYYLD